MDGREERSSLGGLGRSISVAPPLAYTSCLFSWGRGKGNPIPSIHPSITSPCSHGRTEGSITNSNSNSNSSSSSSFRRRRRQSMEPSASASADPPRRSPWRHPSNGGNPNPNGDAVIDTTSWPALSEAARNPPKPPPCIDSPSEVCQMRSLSSSSFSYHRIASSLLMVDGCIVVMIYIQGQGKQSSRHKPARRGGAGADHSPSPRDDRATSWDHGRHHHHHNSGGRRGSFGGRRRGGGGGGFDALYRAPIGPYVRGATAPPPPPPPPMAVAPPPFLPPPLRPFAAPLLFHHGRFFFLLLLCIIFHHHHPN